MKIIRLASENVKRLTAVEITPDGNLVTIGGKNGAGKSSVLDSIAYALGGEKLVPAEPIRAGATDAKIVVDLGDFTVTRRFFREKFPCNCSELQDASYLEKDPKAHHDDCHSRLLGETKSALAITNKEGAKYPSPQKMLDGLLGKLTFDPLAFSREDSKKQNEMLRQLTSLDFSMLNTNRKAAYDRRTMHNKSVVIAEGKLAAMPEHSGTPAEPISIEEISTEIKKGQELQRAAEVRIQAAEAAHRVIERLQKDRAGFSASIAEINSQIEALQDLLAAKDSLQARCDIAIEEETKKAEELVRVAAEAKKAVPNFEQLDARLREVDNVNTKVRANLARVAQQKEVERLKTLAEEETKAIENIDVKKASMLEAAKFPVPGLGLSDDGVTYNDIPLEQASASEQLRISIAIGLALNPALKVLLIRNGNLLDEDSLKLVTEMAMEAQAQVWMEFVSSSGDGMTVMMEDGHVK